MTDPDQPFRRPQQAHQPPDNSGQPTEASGEPLLLDPELHQSVWKPWQDPTGPPKAHLSGGSPTSGLTKRTKTFTAINVLALALTLALVAAVVVPRLLHTPTWRSQPLVVDISTQPETSWSSERGEPCSDQPDEDQAILTDFTRVWSLDLEDGRTLWSRDLDGYGRITCLPGANLVAVTEFDDEDGTLSSTTFLDASTGADMGELPDDSITHVIPLGRNIGLVDDTNMLRSVHPANLDSPLWSRQLQGPPGELADITVKAVDDNVSQLNYYADSGNEDPNHVFTLIVAVADGTSPPWSQGPSTGSTDYQRLGDVVTRRGEESVGVFDLQGQELWGGRDDLMGIAGSNLYVSWPWSSEASAGYTNLHKVDPRTGTPTSNDTYQGLFDHTVAATDHIAVLRGSTLHILDEYLQEQPTISIEGFSILYEGHTSVYTESFDLRRDGGAGRLLSAIDPDRGRVLWTMDLDSGQYIEQLGRHLILVNDDGYGSGTIHGLTGRP